MSPASSVRLPLRLGRAAFYPSAQMACLSWARCLGSRVPTLLFVNHPPPPPPPFPAAVWLHAISIYCLALIHVIWPQTIVLKFDWMCCLRSKTVCCLTSAPKNLVSVLTAHNVTGHSCWGILNGPGTGLVMAELIAEGKASSVDIRRLDPQRLA